LRRVPRSSLYPSPTRYLGRYATRGRELVYEIKHDGYRSQVLIKGGQVRVLTRNGHDWTDRYPSIVAAAAKLKCKSAIIDGEAIVQDGDGISDFDGLSFAMRWRPNAIILYAFDLLHLDGRDLRRQPLSERRSILNALVGNDDESRIQFSEEFHGDGDAFFKACAERKLEGIAQNSSWSARIETAR
jgi:ATP-dependent DNA ligase